MRETGTVSDHLRLCSCGSEEQIKKEKTERKIIWLNECYNFNIVLHFH